MAETTKEVFGILNLVWLIRDTRLSCHGSTKQLLTALALRSDHRKNFTCWPSIVLLAEDCECSEDTVDRNLKVLRGLELISITPRKRAGSKERDTNLYRVNIAKIQALHNLQQAERDAEKIDVEALKERYNHWCNVVTSLNSVVKQAENQKDAVWDAWMKQDAANVAAAYEKGGLEAARLQTAG